MDYPTVFVPAEPVRKSPTDWIRVKAPEDWKRAAAAQAGKWEEQWPLLTEDEFDAAITAAGEIRIG